MAKKREHEKQGDLFEKTEFERKEDFDPVEQYREYLSKIKHDGGIVVRIQCLENKALLSIKVDKNSVIALADFFNNVKKIYKKDN